MNKNRKDLFFILFQETKNQWARDDPAFLVLLMVFLVGMNVWKKKFNNFYEYFFISN